MGWLRDAIIELCTRLFNYLFRGEHSASAKIDEDDAKFQKQIKDNL